MTKSKPLPYPGGVVSGISRPVPGYWDVPLEHSYTVLLSVTIYLFVPPPFSRRRCLTTTPNALPLSSTAPFLPVSLISSFQPDINSERKTYKLLKDRRLW